MNAAMNPPESVSEYANIVGMGFIPSAVVPEADRKARAVIMGAVTRDTNRVERGCFAFARPKEGGTTGDRLVLC
jgi:hypothetical protein